jgi:signal peptidase
MKSEYIWFLLSKYHHQYFLILFRNSSYAKYLTKGDDNQVDDRGLYSPGQLWLEKTDIIGKVKG